MTTKDVTFTVIFEPLENGGYQVTVPAIPEVITAGRTLEEAREMAQDAIRCALEGLIQEGQPLPEDIIREPLTEKLRVSLKVA